MKELKAFVSEALAEDIGQGDVTTKATIDEAARCHAWIIAKQDGILSGVRPFRMVFETLDADIEHWEALPDGAHFKKGSRLIEFSGRTRAILMGERVALNFLQRLSGVATLTGEYIKAVEGYSIKICDTRKTTPLMRKLQKEAVVHGGGSNHRYALFDGVLIKENHIVGAGGIRQAVARASEGTHHLMKIGVEVTTLEELDEAVEAGAEAVLLDNMDLDTMRQAVERLKGTKIIIEASGNVTLSRVRDIAETGVHLVSVGALTHSAHALDLSLVIKNA